MRLLLPPVAFCVLASATIAISSDATPAAYAAKVTYREGRPIKFAAFDLIYTGKRRVVPPQYPRGWWAHDFTVRSGGSDQKISWSAGTGDVGPTRFTVKGTAYHLELSHSDRLGALKEDELVVTPAKD